MAHDTPELVEVGIATAVFGVIIMVILLVQINKSLHTLDVTELKSLKG
jgi:hydrogenase-4 membrane subunit HyfE